MDPLCSPYIISHSGGGFFFGRCEQTCFVERCGQTLFQLDLQQAVGEVLFPGFRVCSEL